MTLDEIKQTYTMREIVERYGIEMKRHGFISCPFHSPDRTPSCKIYEKTFYCFACGAHGSVLDFIMEMENIGFKEAFLLLGGTYKNNKAQQNIAKYHAQKNQEKRAAEEKKAKEKKEENSKLIHLYREQLKQYEPFSDEWCAVQQKLQYQIYIRDCCHDI